jgi:hypothetical protein
MKIKKMPENQFREIMKRNWVPVQVSGGAIPTFLRHIPSFKLHAVYASGGPYTDMVYSGGAVPADGLIGGIDVYRNAPDDPVALNKDWYAVIRTADQTDYLVAGPIKDNEHWLNELPARLANVEILSVPPKSRRSD